MLCCISILYPSLFLNNISLIFEKKKKNNDIYDISIYGLHPWMLSFFYYEPEKYKSK